MPNKKIKPFKAGDKLKQHHIDFLTNVAGAETSPAGKVMLSARRHFELAQAVTDAGAKSLNKALADASADPDKLLGDCPPGANHCISWMDPDTFEVWHSFSK